MGDLTDLVGVVPPVQIIEIDDAPFSVTYTFPGKNFATTWTARIDTPAGFRGVVRAISLHTVTADFTSVTTPAYVYVGIQGDTDAFVTSAALTLHTENDLAQCPALTRGATTVIQPGTEVHITGVAPTGGTPGGTATTEVTIQYFK